MRGRTFTTMDGLRGVAALMVMLFHAPAGSGFPEGAYLAVELFFALSGFVLAHSSMARLGSVGAVAPFMIKRLIRLYPLYLVGMALGILAYIITAAADGNFWPTGLVAAVALNGLFLPLPQTVSFNGWSAFPLNGPSWSLALEMFVNLLMALTVVLYRPGRLLGLVILSAIALISAGMLHGSLDGGSSFSTYYVGIARVLFSFFAGIGLYRLHAAGRLSVVVPWWVSVGALLALLCLPLSGPARVLGDLTIVLFVFPLLLATSTGTRPLPVLQYLGRISYAVYILHLPILHLMDQASLQVMGREYEAFGHLGTALFVVVVFLVASVIDPLDALVRRLLTRWLARSRDPAVATAGSR